MLLRLAGLFAGLCVLYPALSQASTIYTLSVDYSALSFATPGTTLDLQFSVPAILTTPTTVTTFLSTSVGPGLSGCVVSNAQLPLSAPAPYLSDVFVNFAAPCGPTNTFIGADAVFLQNLTSDGVYNAYARQNGSVLGTLTISSSVPEPATVFLLGGALAAIAAGRLRIKRLQ